MNPAIKDRWVAALRSGKYKQGRGNLREEDIFCCLGVLCDLSMLAEWKTNNCIADTYIDSSTRLPTAVQNWAGLKDQSGFYASKGCLIEDNDEGLTFEQIANIIEEWF